MQALGATLAYDPVQIGWVRLDDADQEAQPANDAVTTPASWRAGLAGTLINLRDWTAADIQIYQQMLDDEILWRYMPETWPGTVTQEMAADLIQIAIAAPHHSVQAVVMGHVPVGQVRLAFAAHDTSASEAEISYWFGRSHWGKGLGRRVVRLATAQGFAEYPTLDTITAYVHPQNPASAKVLTHAGYSEDAPRHDGWRTFRITR
jgi:RimJ/RimL family protein N-acetyltransferase